VSWQPPAAGRAERLRRIAAPGSRTLLRPRSTGKRQNCGPAQWTARRLRPISRAQSWSSPPPFASPGGRRGRRSGAQVQDLACASACCGPPAMSPGRTRSRPIPTRADPLCPPSRKPLYDQGEARPIDSGPLPALQYPML